MPYATPRVIDIAAPPWNQMDVAMENCLASGFSNIYPHIETTDGGVASLDFRTHQAQQLVTIGQLRIRYIEVFRDVAFRYDQCMQRCNR